MSRGVLAIDIGASSGRHMLGRIEQGKLVLTELYRFPNSAEERDGHLIWDVDALWGHILAGMKECARQGVVPASVGVDTWGVDYVLADAQGRRLGTCAAYRDRRSAGMDARLEQTLSFSGLYRRTGIAKQPFNTLYQLMAEPPERLRAAGRLLCIPDWFHYRLSGVMKNEYTIASTGALLNAATGTWDVQVLRAAGIPAALFPEPPVPPGTVVGSLCPEVAAQVGYSCQVVLPASHDTGSAFMAVPARDDRAATLSSGTWSLLGTELARPVITDEARAAGFTNEGGYGGTIRFLRNIMGLWILQCVRHEINDRYTFTGMAELAAGATDTLPLLNVSDNRFLAPKSMLQELYAALAEKGVTREPALPELLRCVNRSLAECYAQAVRRLESLTGKRFTSLNVVGGGSQNRLLNQLTADATGMPVYAGPGEGTALGNAIAQLIALRELDSLAQARAMIRDSFDIQLYQPRKEA